MHNPVVIRLPPNRQNIKYVLKPTIKKKEFAHILAHELLTLRTLTPKTVVFCATVKQVADMNKELGIAI